MSGTFSSMNSALSALRYNRVAMDVASQNIANAPTTGYARRQVVAQSTGAPAVPALWSKWDGAGGGVEASSVNRLVDPVIDARARTEHSAASFLDMKSTSLTRLETAIAEPGDGGVAKALDDFKSAWHNLSNSTPQTASTNRTAVLSAGATLSNTISGQAAAVDHEWDTQHTALDNAVTEVNALSGQLADLNRGLRAANLSGTDAGTLLDQRDTITLRLAELTGAKVGINADTTAEVTVGGQTLVSGNTAHQVSVGGATGLAGVGGDPVTLAVDGTTVVVGTGEAGAAQSMLNTELPGYLGKLDGFVAEMTSAVNAQQMAGKDQDGNPGAEFWSGTTAATVQVAITDGRALAGADPAKGATDGSNAAKLGNLDLGAGSYRSLVTAFGSAVASVKQGAGSQATLSAAVDAQRESLSGVNQDEEMVNLMAAQRGYEGAARVLTAMDSMLDTLINNTGMVGR